MAKGRTKPYTGKPLSPNTWMRRKYLRQLWLFGELRPEIKNAALDAFRGSEYRAGKWLFSEQVGLPRIPADMCTTVKGRKAVLTRLRRVPDRQLSAKKTHRFVRDPVTGLTVTAGSGPQVTSREIRRLLDGNPPSKVKSSTGARAKLFRNAGSQAVRLPRGFRLPGDEVSISRTPTGGVLLEPLNAELERRRKRFIALAGSCPELGDVPVHATPVISASKKYS